MVLTMGSVREAPPRKRTSIVAQLFLRGGKPPHPLDARTSRALAIVTNRRCVAAG
jgi:hypothetical protein